MANRIADIPPEQWTHADHIRSSMLKSVSCECGVGPWTDDDLPVRELACWVGGDSSKWPNHQPPWHHPTCERVKPIAVS